MHSSCKTEDFVYISLMPRYMLLLGTRCLVVSFGAGWALWITHACATALLDYSLPEHQVWYTGETYEDIDTKAINDNNSWRFPPFSADSLTDTLTHAMTQLRCTNFFFRGCGHTRRSSCIPLPKTDSRKMKSSAVIIPEEQPNDVGIQSKNYCQKYWNPDACSI